MTLMSTSYPSAHVPAVKSAPLPERSTGNVLAFPPTLNTSVPDALRGYEWFSTQVYERTLLILQAALVAQQAGDGGQVLFFLGSMR
jgi:hypothetical protein